MIVPDGDQMPEDALRSTGVLVRSHMEITRILRQLARDGALLSTEIGDTERLFLTRVLHVDPDGDFFVLAYSEERPANALLLAQAHVVFRTSDKRGYIEFVANTASETVFDGAPAVRFPIPLALVRSQRREHPRFNVRADASLRCIADNAGIASFEARIIDVSRGGLGDMIYEPGVNLSPGTVLRGCKIMIADSEPIIAELEVRYTVWIEQPDGNLARRSGVKFLGEPKGRDALLDRFFIEFGENRQKP